MARAGPCLENGRGYIWNTTRRQDEKTLVWGGEAGHTDAQMIEGRRQTATRGFFRELSRNEIKNTPDAAWTAKAKSPPYSPQSVMEEMGPYERERSLPLMALIMIRTSASHWQILTNVYARLVFSLQPARLLEWFVQPQRSVSICSKRAEKRRRSACSGRHAEGSPCWECCSWWRSFWRAVAL